MKAWMSPRCVKQMYLGSRAGSHSPRYTSLASFTQMILNCFVVLACFWGWGRGSFQLWICVTEHVSSGCGVLELFREGLSATPGLPSADRFHLTPKAEAGGTRTEASCGHQTGNDQQLRITSPFSPLPVPLGWVRPPRATVQGQAPENLHLLAIL